MSVSQAAHSRVRAVVEPVVAAAGLEIDSLAVTSAGRRSILRMTVDADAGVDLDAVARVSRAVSDALDDASAAALFDGPYSLEVSSPGVDRPLRDERHWRRALGRLVCVDVAGTPTTARVAAVTGDGVRLRSAEGSERDVPWAELGPGRVQVEFRRRDDGDAGGEAG